MDCKICSNLYSEANKPRILHCGHTFCTNCIYQIYDTSRRNCPLCKAPLPYKPESIPVNYGVLELKANPLTAMLTIKVVLLGDTSVGKTTLAYSFKNKAKYTKQEKSTINLDIFPVLMSLPSGEQVILEVWDTPGSKDLNQLCKLHYRNAHACILVFDICDELSLKGCDNWYNTIIEKNPLISILLIANKCDKPENEHEVTQSQINEFIIKHPSVRGYKSASSYEYINVVECFEAAAQEAFNYKKKFSADDKHTVELKNPNSNEGKCC